MASDAGLAHTMNVDDGEDAIEELDGVTSHTLSVSHGVPILLNEFAQHSPSHWAGQSVRVMGQIVVTDFANNACTIQRGEHELIIDLQFVGTILFAEGSLVQFIGEMYVKDDSLRLRARVYRCLDGVDVNLYERVTKLRRKYLRMLESGRAT